MFAERMNNKGNHHQGYNDNSWGGQVRKSYDYYNQNSNNRGDYQHQQHEGGKIEQRMQNLRLDGSSGGAAAGNKTGSESSGGPKKMTWATIASQPAKPQISTTNTTTKKKGPGMPPPPMIPGKHNIDLNDGWDTPKNIVPPSPPVITAPPVDLSLDKQNNTSFDGQPAWPTPEQAVSQNNNQQNTQNSSNHSQAPTTQPQQHSHQSQQYHQQQHLSHSSNNNNNNNNQRGNSSGGGNGGGYHHMNNNVNKYDKYENNSSSNSNNNYHGRQYNQNSGSNQHYNSSNYNDYQKPYHQHPHQMPSAPSHQQNQLSNVSANSAPITRASMQPPQHQQPPQQQSSDLEKQETDESILEQLRVKNQYNPSELDLSLVDKARFFVIKSYSEDDIHRSIKYEIWCSTEHGNKRLDQAFREREKEDGVIYLFFSVNSSGHFCGVAQMITPVDYSSNSSVWSQDKWKGSFRVKWVYVKDVPNTQLRHIRLENNENKPVTNSRDTQEVPNGHGIQIMKIVHSYKHTTSIFDDFTHYEKRQEEEDSRKSEDSYTKTMTLPASHHSSHNREYNNGGGFDRGNNYNNNGSYNKYGGGSGSYNNDYKQGFNNGRGGGYHNKRNDFRNDRNGDQPSGFYRAKDYPQDREDFISRSGGGYRSDRGGSRGRGGFRSMNHN